MVVGLPGLPTGSWRFHLDMSKFPPGAQLGLRAATETDKRNALTAVLTDMVNIVLIVKCLIGKTGSSTSLKGDSATCATFGAAPVYIRPCWSAQVCGPEKRDGFYRENPS